MRPNHFAIVVWLLTLCDATWAQEPKQVADQDRPRLIPHLQGPLAPVVFSPNGKWLVNGAGGMWEVATGRQIRFGNWHASGSVAMSRDGKFFVTGHADTTARMRDLETGREIRVFKGHRGAVTFVALTADGKTLVTASSEDGTTRFWDVATAKEFRVIDWQTGKSVLAMSSDARWLFSPKERRNNNDPCAVRLFDCESGKPVREFKGDTSGIYSLVVSRDDKWLMAGGLRTTFLWEVATGKQIRVFEDPERVYGVALSDDGKWLAATTGGKAPTVQLWDLASGKKVRSMPGYEVAFSPDSKTLFADGTIWDVNTGKKIRDFATAPYGNAVRHALTPDGKFFTLADLEGNKTHCKIHCWDFTKGKLVRTIDAGKDNYGVHALSADGKCLVTRDDKVARLWDVETGKSVRAFKGHTAYLQDIAFSHDGQWVATVEEDNARIWELGTGKELQRFINQSKAWEVRISRDRKWLLTNGHGAARLWDVASGTVAKEFENGRGYMYAVAFSPDCKQFLIGSERAFDIWDLPVPKKRRTIQCNWLYEAAFSPDGKWLFTTSESDAPRLPRHAGGMTVRIWETSMGRILERPFAFDSQVWRMSCTDDGKRLVTSHGLYGMTRIWDTATGTELCQLVHFQDGTWAAFDPDGRYDASNDGNVDTLHWAVGPQTFPLKQFRDRFYEPGLIAKHMGFNKEPLRKVDVEK